MRIQRRVLLLAAMSVAAMLNGCVTSERSVFQRQMNQSMAHDPIAHEDVAFAFGLDDYAPNRPSVTALADDKHDR